MAIPGRSYRMQRRWREPYVLEKQSGTIPWKQNFEAGPLVVGIVSPLGINSNSILIKLKQCFAKYGYEVQHIKISSMLNELIQKSRIAGDPIPPIPSSEFARISSLMDAGDRMRKASGQGGVLAAMAVGKISEIKSRYSNARYSLKTQKTTNKIAFVVDSIKNPEEIHFLRRVYGELLLPIAMFLPRSKRHENLVGRFRKNPGSKIPANFTELADLLIQRDEAGSSDGYGQDVRKSFAEADAFIDLQNDASVVTQLERILDLWFRSPYITPTREEFGMFLAWGSSLKSADLSRQVGAAVLTEEGSILSVGYNEVPKPGGGGFWEGDANDRRDFCLGKDYNVSTRVDIYRQLAEVLFDANVINTTAVPNVEKFLEAFTSGAIAESLKGTRIANLIEFGRIVHAEMMAITDAANRGVALHDATLICTTFPCHMCARHIISSGITRVVYIEPYPKSMTPEMYEGLVCLDSENRDSSSKKVQFNPFIGVGPKRYMTFFRMPKRKDGAGESVVWDASESFPEVTPRMYDVVRDSEVAVRHALKETPEVFGLVPKPLA